MIYVTGDTHGTIDFIKLLDDKYKNLTKDDYVIICGDCGVCFDKDSSKIINLYQYLPFSVLFVDGNHENFDLLYSYPIEMWKGGKVHRISEHVLHLMRGQVFNIAGEKIFTFGGALSFDKSRRIEGKSWWSQELPTDVEYNEAVKNLLLNSNKVDYVVSHDCPMSWMGAVKQSTKIMYEGYVFSSSNIFLERIANQIKFKHWFFGHYHEDNDIDSYATELFHRIIPLQDYKNLSYIEGKYITGDCSSHNKPDKFDGYKLFILGDNGCTFSEDMTIEAFFNSSNAHKSGIRTSYDTWWMMVAHTLGIKEIYNLSRVNNTLDEVLKYAREQESIEEEKTIVIVNLESMDSNDEKYKWLKDEILRVIPNGIIYEILFEKKESIYENFICITKLEDDEKYMGYPNRKGMYKVACAIVDALFEE